MSNWLFFCGRLICLFTFLIAKCFLCYRILLSCSSRMFDCPPVRYLEGLTKVSITWCRSYPRNDSLLLLWPRPHLSGCLRRLETMWKTGKPSAKLSPTCRYGINNSHTKYSIKTVAKTEDQAKDLPPKGKISSTHQVTRFVLYCQLINKHMNRLRT